MNLLPLHTTSRTFGGQTVHSTLVEVLLCIGLAMALATSCQLEETWCRCCFVLRGDMHFVKVVVADTTAAEALALWAHVPDNEGALGHCLSSSHMLLHESQALIFLVKACQLIFDYCFDLLFRILQWIFLSFDVLLLGWVLSGWRKGVHSKHHRLAWWLLWWLFKSSDLRSCLLRFCESLWLGGCLGCFEDLSSGRLR
jgi:hypothetical protein